MGVLTAWWLSVTEVTLGKYLGPIRLFRDDYRLRTFSVSSVNPVEGKEDGLEIEIVFSKQWLMI